MTVWPSARTNIPASSSLVEGGIAHACALGPSDLLDRYGSGCDPVPGQGAFLRFVCISLVFGLLMAASLYRWSPTIFDAHSVICLSVPGGNLSDTQDETHPRPVSAATFRRHVQCVGNGIDLMQGDVCRPFSIS